MPLASAGTISETIGVLPRSQIDIENLTLDFSRRMTETAQLGCALTCEAGASLLAFHLYPFGLSGRSVPLIPSIRPHKRQRKIPVLFVHGVFHNPTAFAWLKQKLAWGGWRNFDEIDLLTSIRSIPSNAEHVARRVERLIQKHDIPRIDIVAHSMGGIVSRYFVQRLGGDKKVRNLITLGTPHGGTDWSRYILLSPLRDLAPDSKLLTELNESPHPVRTQTTAVAGRLDIFNRPRGSHLWPGARNFELRGVGHAGLLFSKRVAQILIARLSEDFD